MTIDSPVSRQTAELRSLWQEAFGDTDEYLDTFFRVAFSPDRCRCTADSGQVAAALYWFDCFCRGRKIAYIYAVATRKGFRHQGLALTLLQNTGKHLQQLGYTGAILMPANESLFALYKKAGYIPGTRITDRTFEAGYVPTQIEQISAEEYDDMRNIYLPAGSVIQDNTAMKFCGTQYRFYRGRKFMLCGTVQQDKLTTQEFLGDMDMAPRILNALHLKSGQFRGPGEDHVFTMYQSFSEDDRLVPSYFGIPMD